MPALQARLEKCDGAVRALRAAAARGLRLVDGLHAVIVGAPNVGKSSLLNALAADERAIVSAVAGTTRDLLREQLRLDGVELTLVDTAGLRESPDAIEAEGMRRARAELGRADLVLLVLDAREPEAPAPALPELGPGATVLRLYNKSDALDAQTLRSELEERARRPEHARDSLWISARSGLGLDALRARLRESAGAAETGAGGSFSARARHLEALDRAGQLLARPKRSCVPARPNWRRRSCGARRRRWARSPRPWMPMPARPHLRRLLHRQIAQAWLNFCSRSWHPRILLPERSGCRSGQAARAAAARARSRRMRRTGPP